MLEKIFIDHEKLFIKVAFIFIDLIIIFIMISFIFIDLTKTFIVPAIIPIGGFFCFLKIFKFLYANKKPRRKPKLLKNLRSERLTYNPIVSSSF